MLYITRIPPPNFHLSQYKSLPPDIGPRGPVRYALPPHPDVHTRAHTCTPARIHTCEHTPTRGSVSAHACTRPPTPFSPVSAPTTLPLSSFPTILWPHWHFSLHLLFFRPLSPDPYIISPALLVTFCHIPFSYKCLLPPIVNLLTVGLRGYFYFQSQHPPHCPWLRKSKAWANLAHCYGLMSGKAHEHS